MNDSAESVYIVIGLNLGWDNIIGVFNSELVSKEELDKIFGDRDEYYIAHYSVETNLYSFK